MEKNFFAIQIINVYELFKHNTVGTFRSTVYMPIYLYIHPDIKFISACIYFDVERKHTPHKINSIDCVEYCTYTCVSCLVSKTYKIL